MPNHWFIVNLKANPHRLVWLAVLLASLVLASSACSLVNRVSPAGGAQATRPPGQPTLAARPATTARPASAVTSAPGSATVSKPGPVATVAVSLEIERRCDECGFTFQPIAGYGIETYAGLVSMEAPDAVSGIGPNLMLASTPVESRVTLDSLVEPFLNAPDIQVESNTPIQVAGVEARRVQIRGKRDGQPVVGLVIVALVSPGRQFTLNASAPGGRWASEMLPLTEAVLASLRFFEPVAAPAVVTPAGERVAMRQWASYAIASSEFTHSDGNAGQAAGEPNTPQCGATPTAWSPAASNDAGSTHEWIELTFKTPVFPSQINIHQSFAPSQVVKVEIYDLDGEYHAVYTADPQVMDACPFVLTIPVEGKAYVALSVKITLAPGQPGHQTAIDAVELVGVPAQ